MIFMKKILFHHLVRLLIFLLIIVLSNSSPLSAAVNVDGDPSTYFGGTLSRNGTYLAWHNDNDSGASSHDPSNSTTKCRCQTGQEDFGNTTLNATSEQEREHQNTEEFVVKICCYEHSIFMASGSDPTQGIALHWTIISGNPPDNNRSNTIFDVDGTTIQMALIGRGGADNGWIALGIAEAGGMPGSDVMVYDIGKGQIEDRFATDYTTPYLDNNNRSDWKLIRVTTQDDGNDIGNSTIGEEEDSFIIVEFYRLLDTGDYEQDRPIRYDGDLAVPPHRVIAAWSTDDNREFGYHGPNQRVSGSIRFWESETVTAGRNSETFYKVIDKEADGYVDIVMPNYRIPRNKATEYASICLNWGQIASQIQQRQPSYQNNVSSLTSFEVPSLQIIGFEPLIKTQFPHHMVLYGSTGDLPSNGGTCNSNMAQNNPVSLQGWAIGEGPVLLPNDVGIPFGPSRTESSTPLQQRYDQDGGGVGGFVSFRLSMHYDNRNLASNQRDQSGFRLYYTSTNLREHTLALLLLGDPLIHLMDQPITPHLSSSQRTATGLSRHRFVCPSTCTKEAMTSSPAEEISPIQEVTVLTELLHMHETGVRMVNRILRRGQVVHEAVIDYWDNQISGLYPYPASNGRRNVSSSTFTLQPGDVIETECYYDESKSTTQPTDFGQVRFGVGSQDEMCIAFLYYYPKVEGLSSCGYVRPGDDDDEDSSTSSSSSSKKSKTCPAEYEQSLLVSHSQVNRTFGRWVWDSLPGPSPSPIRPSPPMTERQNDILSSPGINSFLLPSLQQSFDFLVAPILLFLPSIL